MLTTDEARAGVERLLARTQHDAEVTLTASREALLRFAGSQPIQHTTTDSVGLRVRLRDGDRFGEAEVDGFDEARQAAALQQAQAQMALLPPDAEPLPSAPADGVLAVDAWHDDARPDHFDAEHRAAAADALTAAAREAGVQAAGICEVAESLVVMGTSQGMRGEYASTSLALDVTAHTDDSSGWRRAWARSAAGLDPERLGREACETALAARDPQPLEPGRYRVLLSAAAVADLLGFFVSGFNARAVNEGRSWLAGRRDERIVGAGVHLRQDVSHPLLQKRPFDDDAMPVERVELTRDGRAANLLYDRRTAAGSDARPTGWSPGGRNLTGAFPAAIVMDGGVATLDDLLAAVHDGVYVSRVWYTNWVDPRECIVTGMTRDGTFRIRDGRLAEPVRNLRFNQNVLELLRGVEALGRAEVAGGGVVPPLVAAAFTFSSTTSF